MPEQSSNAPERGELELPPERGRVIETVTIPVRVDVHIGDARQQGRVLAAQAGFSPGDQAVIAAAISEVARNMVRYARNGTVEIRLLKLGPAAGLRIIARDHGPGIADVGLAMQEGFSTSRSLGLGLTAARRVMDEFAIVSKPGIGTAIAMTKWSTRVDGGMT
jgi:serine/threonine-protein kinase RsbT